MVTDDDPVPRLPPGAGGDALAELSVALRRLGRPCRLALPDGRVLAFGEGAPAFGIVLNSDLPLAHPPTAFSLARAYVDGDLDVSGDLMAVLDLREFVPIGIPLAQVVRLAHDLLLPPTVA